VALGLQGRGGRGVADRAVGTRRLSAAKRKKRQAGRRPTPARSSQPVRTADQRAALDELQQLAMTYPAILLNVEVLPRSTAPAAARLRISTADVTRLATGLPISSDYEDVIVTIPDDYPDIPPAVWVEHDRFLHGAHVLSGGELCIYLDPTREWHPTYGMEQAIKRLRDWFGDAANGNFDSRTALFHVSAVAPRSPSADP
jgi:hypothetical protein